MKIEQTPGTQWEPSKNRDCILSLGVLRLQDPRGPGYSAIGSEKFERFSITSGPRVPDLGSQVQKLTSEV